MYLVVILKQFRNLVDMIWMDELIHELWTQFDLRIYIAHLKEAIATNIEFSLLCHNH